MRICEGLELLQCSIVILSARSHHQNGPNHPAVRTKDVEIPHTGDELRRFVAECHIGDRPFSIAARSHWPDNSAWHVRGMVGHSTRRSSYPIAMF